MGEVGKFAATGKVGPQIQINLLHLHHFNKGVNHLIHEESNPGPCYKNKEHTIARIIYSFSS